jgi:hypothetical protein
MFIFLAIGLAVGLAIGHSIGKGSSKCSDCPEPVTTPPVTTHPPPANISREYKWGDKVKVDGKDVKVVDWVDGIMQEDNIRNNLE